MTMARTLLYEDLAKSIVLYSGWIWMQCMDAFLDCLS